MFLPILMKVNMMHPQILKRNYFPTKICRKKLVSTYKIEYNLVQNREASQSLMAVHIPGIRSATCNHIVV